MLEIINYTENCIVLKGVKTKVLKEEIKKIYGKYNPNLKDKNGERFSGWVFSKKREDIVRQFIIDYS